MSIESGYGVPVCWPNLNNKAFMYVHFCIGLYRKPFLVNYCPCALLLFISIKLRSTHCPLFQSKWPFYYYIPCEKEVQFIYCSLVVYIKCNIFLYSLLLSIFLYTLYIYITF